MSAITVLELMNQAKSVANSSYRYIEPITLVGVFFLVISLISVVRAALARTPLRPHRIVRDADERHAGHPALIPQRRRSTRARWTSASA